MDIRKWLQAMRLFGASMNTSVILLGASTAGMDADLLKIFQFIVIGTLSHATTGLVNEVYERGEERFEGKHPLKSKADKEFARKFLIPILFTMAISLSIVFMGVLATCILALSGLMGIYYCVYGKYIRVMYDISPAIAIGLLVIYGSYATIGGKTAPVVIIAISVFVLGLMMQWAGGMKDVEIDRKFGGGSTAIISGHRVGEPILKGLNGLYFVILTLLFVGVLFVPVWFGWGGFGYLLFWIFIILPLQSVSLFLLFRRKSHKNWLRKYNYYFFSSQAIIPIAFLFFYRGWELILIIVVYGIIWNLLMRFSKIRYV